MGSIKYVHLSTTAQHYICIVHRILTRKKEAKITTKKLQMVSIHPQYEFFTFVVSECPIVLLKRYNCGLEYRKADIDHFVKMK